MKRNTRQLKKLYVIYIHIQSLDEKMFIPYIAPGLVKYMLFIDIN